MNPYHIKNTENSEHYIWGENCYGWHFVKTDSLSVIRESMPPDSSEKPHYHVQAQQFFYILSGTATFEIEGNSEKVEAGRGIHISPGTVHRILNTAADTLEFIVISEPKSHGDRINV